MWHVSPVYQIAGQILIAAFAADALVAQFSSVKAFSLPCMPIVLALCTPASEGTRCVDDWNLFFQRENEIALHL